MMNRYTATLFGAIAMLILAVPAFTAASGERPDLSGTYDVSTLTPLQRPQEFGDNLELTRERANAIDWPTSDEKVYEYACHEGNCAMEGILRGARLLESEKRAGITSSGD